MNEAVALTLKQYRDATSVILGVLMPAAVFGSIFAMLYRYGVPDWVSLLVAGVIAYEVFRMTITQKSGHRRGRRRVKYIEAKAIAQRYLRPEDPGFEGFGGVTLPHDARQKGVMIQGEMGSGKSTTMALLAEANVPTDLDNTRAVFTDVKTKLVSSLCGLGYPIERIKIFNPYDARCVGLDFCADIDTHDISLGVAEIFVPDERDSNPFFANAARLLMHGVMYSFIRTVAKTKEENERRLTTEEGFTVTSRLDDVRYSTQESLLPEFQWTFRDVCLALQDVSDAREILERHDETKTFQQFLERENNDVHTTILTRVLPLYSIAARWDEAEQAGRASVSLREWRNSKEGLILVLGHNTEAAPAIKALNRVIVQRLTQITLNPEVDDYGDSYFFLDEFATLGRIPEFESFVTTAREYNGTVILGFQNPEQIVEHYDERVTATILQEMASKAYLKCSGNAAKRAAEEIGEYEGDETTYSESNKLGEFPTKSKNTRPEKRYAVMKEEIAGLPIFREGHPLCGFYLSSFLDTQQGGGIVYRHEYSQADLAHIIKPHASEPDFIAHQKRDAVLRRWTPEERTRLGLSRKQEQKQQRKQEDSQGDDQKTEEPKEQKPPEEPRKKRRKITLEDDEDDRHDRRRPQ